MILPEVKAVPLKATKNLQVLMGNLDRDMREAKSEGKKIAWGTGSAPMDILLAMDIIPTYPESYIAACGASRSATPLCEMAEEMGYSQDICSYSRSGIGFNSLENPESLKIPPPPKPDIILGCTGCNTHVKWWEQLGRHFNVPVLMLETPFIHKDLSRDDIQGAIKYVENQLKEMVRFISEFCGKPYNYDKLQECVSNTAEAAKLYQEFVNTGKTRPSSISAFDCFTHLAPLMQGRGFAESIDYYQILVKEARQRVKDGFSAVGTENYRLYLDNIPVWYKVGWLSRRLAGQGACAVTSVYPWFWIDMFAGQDGERPLESIAERQQLAVANHFAEHRIQWLSELTREFSVDGLLVPACATCKMYLPEQGVIIRETQKKTGLPAGFIEGDMVDERYFDENRVTQQLEDFFSIMQLKMKRRSNER